MLAGMAYKRSASVIIMLLFGALTSQAQAEATSSESVNGENTTALNESSIDAPTTAGKGKKWDIVQFLNTSDPIWTYMSTSATAEVCRVDIIQEITAYNASLHRYFNTGRRSWKEISLNARFTTWTTKYSTPYSTMVLTRLDGASYSVETLIYETSDKLCAIFSTSDRTIRNPRDKSPREVHFDIRVKTSAINGVDEPACLQEAKRAMPKNKNYAKVYQAACLRRLQNHLGNESSGPVRQMS
uniref:Lipocalin/cytosolic fatty-acid binding domain-containing protein n=1 Tax=Amblyomma maculatum TaxID=34609 RepID=G3MQM6_AMBMU